MEQKELEELKDIPIVEVAERLGMATKRRGSSIVACCPWHEDRHPSLVIGGRYNRCKCMACGEGGSTIDLVMQVQGLDFKGACEWLSPSPKSSPSMGRTFRRMKRSLPIEEEGRGEGLVFDYSIALSYVSVENSFSRCMTAVFGPEVAERVTRDYLLGLYDEAGRDDDVLFPSIDAQGMVRDMKIQHYETDPGSPDFFHCDKRHILWWAGLLQKAGRVPLSAIIDRNCLFGEHLLTRYPSRDVVLVESPKNACLGSAVWPDFVWVATGNKSQLKRPVLGALRGRRVIVIPDRDAHEEWKKMLDTMQDIATFHVSDVLKDMKEEKGDIGDLILEPLSPANLRRSLSPTRLVLPLRETSPNRSSAICPKGRE